MDERDFLGFVGGGKGKKRRTGSIDGFFAEVASSAAAVADGALGRGRWFGGGWWGCHCCFVVWFCGCCGCCWCCYGGSCTFVFCRLELESRKERKKGGKGKLFKSEESGNWKGKVEEGKGGRRDFGFRCLSPKRNNLEYMFWQFSRWLLFLGEVLAKRESRVERNDKRKEIHQKSAMTYLYTLPWTC